MKCSEYIKYYTYTSSTFTLDYSLRSHVKTSSSYEETEQKKNKKTKHTMFD